MGTEKGVGWSRNQKRVCEKMRKLKFSEKLGALAFLLLSGSYAFVDVKYVIGFMAISFFIFIYNKGYRNSNLKLNLGITILLSFWAILTTQIMRKDAIDNTYLQYVLYPFASFFLFSSYSFERFRNALLIMLSFILGVSIVVHFLYMFHIISAVFDPEAYKFICFKIFNVHNGDDAFLELPFGDYYRFSSIYGEPGQLGCVLIFILVSFTDKISILLYEPKKLFKQYGVIMLAIIMSCSTTTYLCAALYFVGLLIFGKSAGKHSLLVYSASVIIVLILAVFMIQSSVVTDKFAQKSSREDTSYSIRMADNLACLEMTKEHPLFGLGRNTQEQRKFFLSHDNRTSSNGWLLASASFGVLYLLYFFYVMHKGLKRMKFGVNKSFLLLVLILQQCNEAAIFLPYVFLYIFAFKDYKFREKDIVTR